MRTKTRKIRPLFFQSAIVFGVRFSDWKFIWGTAFGAFIFALIFHLQYKGLHLALPLSIFSLLGGAAFFNWVRKSRRPFWLEHNIAHQWRVLWRKKHDLERVPVGTPKNVQWLLETDDRRRRTPLKIRRHHALKQGKSNELV